MQQQSAKFDSSQCYSSPYQNLFTQSCKLAKDQTKCLNDLTQYCTNNVQIDKDNATITNLLKCYSGIQCKNEDDCKAQMQKCEKRA